MIISAVRFGNLPEFTVYGVIWSCLCIFRHYREQAGIQQFRTYNCITDGDKPMEYPLCRAVLDVTDNDRRSCGFLSGLFRLVVTPEFRIRLHVSNQLASRRFKAVHRNILWPSKERTCGIYLAYIIFRLGRHHDGLTTAYNPQCHCGAAAPDNTGYIHLLLSSPFTLMESALPKRQKKSGALSKSYLLHVECGHYIKKLMRNAICFLDKKAEGGPGAALRLRH